MISLLLARPRTLLLLAGTGATVIAVAASRCVWGMLPW